MIVRLSLASGELKFPRDLEGAGLVAYLLGVSYPVAGGK